MFSNDDIMVSFTVNQPMGDSKHYNTWFPCQVQTDKILELYSG